MQHRNDKTDARSTDDKQNETYFEHTKAFQVNMLSSECDPSDSIYLKGAKSITLFVYFSSAFHPHY